MKRIAAIFSLAAGLVLCALLMGHRTAAPASLAPPATKPQTGATSTSGALTATWRLSDPDLAVGGLRDELLELDLVGKRGPEGRRAPVNLAVVLDRSGSMAGEKLESARRAAHALIDRLDAGDRLAFVTFGTEVTLLFPSTPCTPEARGDMHRAVDGIYDLGGTNLSGGIQAGLHELLTHAGGGAVNRVVLISDGEANEGITSRAGLAALARTALGQDVSLTALGVGADFDEDTLQRLAEEGGGDYRFLATGGGLTQVFDAELAQLSTAVAGAPTVHLTLTSGVRVVDVPGYAFEQSGRALTVHLPDVAAGGHRKLVVQLQVPAEALGDLRVAQAQLDYTDLLHGRAPTTLTWSAAATGVPTPAEAEANRDRQSYATLARVTAGHRAAQAAALYAQGDVGGGRAMLEKGRAEAHALNKVAQDATLGAALDEIAPAPSAMAPAATPEARRLRAKELKQRAFDAYR